MTTSQLPTPLRERALTVLRATFGFGAFRPLQEEIVAAVLAGRDTFVLMPTGGGKSLCYQLPALMLDGITIVVSPLIALMQDQVDQLTALGVPATFINSSLDLAEMERRRQAVARGDVKLLYVAPERFASPGFLNLLSRTGVTRFAIDEAHCISEWGHDFRPDYRELKRLRQLFPETPFAAFTATATARVQQDIVAQLGLKNAARFRGSFNRANLFYDVRPKRNTYEQLRRYLRGRRRDSGIIYCQSRDGTERLAERLRADGFSATAYHAGLDPEERRGRQDAFIRDEVRIIVATIAFGMGIDKPDVRFVVHYDLPRNLEGYYQESGRAGRDGDPADCILFYSYGDVTKLMRFVDEKPPAERRIAVQQVRQMANWASDPVCRRRALLAYFDEQLPGSADGAPCCDVCRDGPAEVEPVDRTIEARMLFAAARQTGERFGATHLINVLRGTPDERTTRWGHDKLKTWGVGAEHSVAEWQHIVRELLREGYLRVDETAFNAVKVTEQGDAVRANKQTVLLRPAPARLAAAGSRGTAGQQAPSAPADEALFEALRAVRRRLASEQAVPPYVIFSDRTLRDMAARRPASRDDLLQISGIGEHKADEYGERFLRAIAEHMANGEVPQFAATVADTVDCDADKDSLFDQLLALQERLAAVGGPAHRLTLPHRTLRLITQAMPRSLDELLRVSGVGQIKAEALGGPILALVAEYRERHPELAQSKGGMAAASATVQRTLELFRAGKSPDAIGEQRGLSTVTVYGHLAEALLLGAELDLDLLIAPERQAAIRAAFASEGDGAGGGPLRPVLDRLGDGYNYGELRLMQAALNAGLLPAGERAGRTGTG
jgi:ATP-dependent DNA helicase RecQ